MNPEEIDSILPPKEGDALYGIEVRARGAAIFLYLREEMGIHRWHLDEPPVYCRIYVSKKPISTPDKIHRKEFYSTQSPRRTIEPNMLRDTLYKINRAYAFQEIVDVMSNHLDQRFKIKIDMEVL